MSEQFSSTSNQSSEPLSPPIRLWAPNIVGFTSFFFGFPGGIVLASINWMRMGLTNKAITHLAGGAIGALMFIILLILLPGHMGKWIDLFINRVLGILVNFGMLFYLQKQTKSDIYACKAANREIQNAHWLSGCLIGLVMLGLFIALFFVIEFFLAFAGVPIPE